MRPPAIAAAAFALALSFGAPDAQAASAWGSPADNPSSAEILLILDNSGSMATTDSQRLRWTAARLFVSLLDEGDSVSIITFSTTSRSMTDGRFLRISGPADKLNLLERIPDQGPDEYTGKLAYTDMKQAFAGAAQMMLELPTTQRARRAVVFLTDGVPEIERPYPTYESETLAAASALRVPFLSIALTPEADTPFLHRLAEATTGPGDGGIQSLVIPARDATKLVDAYLEVLRRLKDRTIVAAGAAVAPGAIDVPLDPALTPFINKISFVVGRQEGVRGAFLRPDGAELGQKDPSIGFSIQEPRFAVQTVARPVPGKWRIKIEGAGRASVVAVLHSRLRIRVVSPPR